MYMYLYIYINKYNNTSYQHIWDSHCICNRSLSPSTIASIISSAFLNISEYFCSSAGHWRQGHRPGVGPGAPHRSGEVRPDDADAKIKFLAAEAMAKEYEGMALANWQLQDMGR